MDFFRVFKKTKGIHGTIFLSFLIVCIIPIICAALGSYYFSANILAERASMSFSEAVSYVKSGVESELYQLKQIMAYIYIDLDLKEAIVKLHSSPDASQKATDKLNDKLKSYLISNTFDYINAIKIYGFNGYRASFGNPTKLLSIDDMVIINSEGFKEALDFSGRTIWSGMNESFYSIQTGEHEKSLELFRVIKEENYKQNIGVIYMSVDPALFKTILSRDDEQYESNIYIIDNKSNVVNYHESAINTDGLINIANQASLNEFYVHIENGNQTKYIHYKINDFGWSILGELPMNDIAHNSNIIFMVAGIALLLYIVISSIVWFFVSSKITKPISKLSAATQSVREGNFSIQVEVLAKNELGELTQNFNYMVAKIQSLIDEVINENTRKKDAEYRALQAQINPHFLYNSLNTIRWMAKIQKAESIKNMIDALGRLLKNSTSKKTQIIKIEEEINILNDYIFLQKIAYKNKFKIVWEVEDDILEYECIKFTLQPIVENSIFHGILPKNGIGTIWITIKKDNGKVVFSVKDDGIGMKPSEVQEIMSRVEDKYRKFSGIGVNNVFERITMSYGNQASYSINSIYGEYTEIRISLPANK